MAAMLRNSTNTMRRVYGLGTLNPYRAKLSVFRISGGRKLSTVVALDHLNFSGLRLFYSLIGPVRFKKVTVCFMNSTRFRALELAYFMPL